MEQIPLILLIFFLFGLRPFIYKPIAKKYPPAIAMIIDGIFAILVSIPIFIFSNDKFIWHPALLLCIINGACLSYQVKLFQIVLKESTSAHQYILIIALGFAVIINKIFGEQLTNGQLLTVILIALVAILFFIRVVSKLSSKAKFAWLGNLLLTVIVVTMPCFLLNYTNWISIFLVNALANFATDVYEFNKCRPELKEKNIKLSPLLLLVGLFASLGELVFMYGNPILGVTTVLVIKRATIPFVIFINNIFISKNEDNKFDNILFSSLAAVLVFFYFLTSKY